MERKSRKAAAAVPKYLFSSDEEESNNDDSLFVLEDTVEFNSDNESKAKKRKTNPKNSKTGGDVPAKKNVRRPSKKKVNDESVDQYDTVASNSTAQEEPGSSSTSLAKKKSKRPRKNEDTIPESPRVKKIKLETSELVPDLSKVKAERFSLYEPECMPAVNSIKQEKCDPGTPNDVKPNLQRVGVKTYFESSDDSDGDCKPNVQNIKLEKGIKEDPDLNTKKSKKTAVVEGKKVKNEVKQEVDSSEPALKKPKKVKKEVKQEAGPSEPAPKKTKKVKNEVKLELHGDFGDENAFSNHRISCKLGEPNWETRMLSDKSNLDFRVARNIISMLQNDCTIPFIARYRRDQTGGLDADVLRHVKDTYDHIKTLETKIQNVKKQIQKLGKMSPQLERCLNGVQSLDELDYIYAPYKQGSSKSKAEKARALGLEDAAQLILNGSGNVIIHQFIDTSKAGLKNNDEVVQSIQNIVADLFSKNDEVLQYLHELEKNLVINIKSTKTKAPKDKENDSKKKTANEDVMGKFEIYYDFETTTSRIQPHQILALNRGENLKILSVKMTIADWLQKKLYSFCERKWLHKGLSYSLRTQMFRASFNDAYSRLISPLLLRRAKSDLNQRAQRAAIENFAVNLKNLLQTPPVKGCSILGIDPGFRHGFKFALINGNGDLLWTNVVHFDLNHKNSPKNEMALHDIREKLIEFQCELIAIGNGTGCRAIEAIISHFISENFFQPELNIQYTIVNERGASVYSCTPLAKEEFPDLDPNLVSAVFVARSLQDPLNEYVKVEPKHLGVGMYQHDVPENRLNSALDEIVSECVSFTGVDVNTASVHLLKRISGLGVVKATSIIEWRRQYGPFKNREQLTLVNRIGQKTYEQCSGFIRIHAKNLCDERDKTKGKPKCTKSGVNDDPNPLDTTWIHPESYTTAYLFIDKCKVDLQNLGTPNFINRVKNAVETESIEKIAADLNENTEKIKLIADALTKPTDYDYRSQFSKPFFKKGLTEMASLKIGMILTGVVGNVTNFGAFVDIGVDKNGLIHVSRMRNTVLQVGDRVSVEILSIEIERGRIGLNLLSILC